MKDRTINRMIDESNRIYRALIWYTAMLVAGIVVIVNPATIDNPLLFGLGLAAIVVSLVAIALNILLINGLNRNSPPPPVTYEDVNDASDILDFPTEHTPTDARIEVHNGNTTRLGRYEPDYGTWANLAEALYKHRWEWSRERALRESGCFKNLTTRYPEITVDMRRMGIIEGRRNHYRASLKGQQWFIEQSDNLFLEHVIQ